MFYISATRFKKRAVFLVRRVSGEKKGLNLFCCKRPPAASYSNSVFQFNS